MDIKKLKTMITDSKLENDFIHWLDHYTARGDKHYFDTPEYRIIELYWDNIVERVLENYSEEDSDEIVERLSNMF